MLKNSDVRIRDSRYKPNSFLKKNTQIIKKKFLPDFFAINKYHIKKKFQDSGILVNNQQLTIILSFIESNHCNDCEIHIPFGYKQTGFIKMSIFKDLYIKKFNYWFRIKILGNKIYLDLNSNKIGSDYYLTYPKKKKYVSDLSGAYKVCELYNNVIDNRILYFKFRKNQNPDFSYQKSNMEYFKKHFRYLHYGFELLKLPKFNVSDEKLNNQFYRSGLCADVNLGIDLFEYCLRGNRKIHLAQFKNVLLEMDILNSYDIFYKDSKVDNSLINKDGNVYFIDFDNMNNLTNIIYYMQKKLLRKPIALYTDEKLCQAIKNVRSIIQGTPSYLPNRLVSCIVKYFSTTEMVRRILISIDLYQNLLTVLLSTTDNRFNLYTSFFHDICITDILRDNAMSNNLLIVNTNIFKSLRQLSTDHPNIDFNNCYKLLTNLKEFINIKEFDFIATRKNLLGLSALN